MSNTQFNSSLGGDNISSLPTDKTPPSQDEIHMVNTLFNEHNQGIFRKIMGDMKDTVLIALLFIIFSLPQIDEFIQKFIPSTTKSTYILLFLKAIMMASVWWIIRYFYLSRK
jgi:hypothetical protein